MTNPTTSERKSERELVVARTFGFPAKVVFEAWTQSALFERWWVPRSCGLTLLACEIDARVGGGYRLAFSHAAAPDPMEVYGKYVEVTPRSRLVWTNEEAGDSGQVTTVSFEQVGEETRLLMQELYPSKQALDDALATGAGEMGEAFEQLDALLTSLHDSPPV